MEVITEMLKFMFNFENVSCNYRLDNLFVVYIGQDGQRKPTNKTPRPSYTA